MREIMKLGRNTVYGNTNFYTGKRISKIPIVLCAVIGVVIGFTAFKLSNLNINLNESAKTAIDSSLEKSDLVQQAFYNFFGIDYYNPLTILSSNYPYFKTFYQNKYLDYVAEKENEELDKKIVADNTQIQNKQSDIQQTQQQKEQNGLKEASSSITFEGDVEYSDQQKNPVVSSGEINIRNATKYTIDIDKLLNEPLAMKPDKTGPKIFVYHTHTTESFLKNIDELKRGNIPTRTTNNQYNVIRVGNALIDNLKKYNINVLHNSTIHDSDYNSSYMKSLKTLTDNLNKYQSIKMAIDLHRDAASGEKLRVVKKINGKDVAQIMFVVGTDSKLENPLWKENLKLAIKLQERLNRICPGLAKPIYISKNRYNQHLLKGSIIIEIGGDGNVIDECVRSTSYLAQAIDDVLYSEK